MRIKVLLKPPKSNSKSPASFESSLWQLASPGYMSTKDRPKRKIKPNWKYAYANILSYAFVAYHDLADNNLKSYLEAIKSKQSISWKEAMVEETSSLHHHKTWVLVSLSLDKRIVV